jgi:hypothetical protein
VREIVESLLASQEDSTKAFKPGRDQIVVFDHYLEPDSFDPDSIRDCFANSDRLRRAILIKDRSVATPATNSTKSDAYDYYLRGR